MPSDHDFDSAIAVEPIDEGRFAATIVEGWDVGGVPHGGYLLALAAQAAGEVLPHDDPISVSASYLAPPHFGPAELHVTVLRAGRRQSTATVRLIQDGIECVDVVATLGTLDAVDPTPLAPELVARPVLPPPEQCISTNRSLEDGGPGTNLHRRVDLRLHPETGFPVGQPSGSGELNGWLRLVDRPTDPAALLLISDGMPPSVFEVSGWLGSRVPTLQLTTHLFARPDPGWIQARFRTRLIAGSLLDEDGDLWDASGRLVGTTRQLALMRS